MEITLLIKSVMGLVIVLGILILLFVYSSNIKANKIKKSKTIVKKKTVEDKEELDLMALKAIIKNKQSSAKELKIALDLILKKHGTITSKLGIRTHPNFEIYRDILFSLCRHKHTTKNHIINFDKELIRLNPEYKSEINDAVTKGLNSRGA